MDIRSPLQSIYQKQVQVSEPLSCLEEAILALIAGDSIQFESILDSYPAWEAHSSDEKIVKNWRSLLVLTLLAYLSKSSTSDLSAQVRFFLREPWNEQSQYLRVIIALNHFLVGLPVPDVHPDLLEGGAVLIDKQEYSPWLSLPYIPYHAEFGALLGILAFLTKREQLKSVVDRLAKWQLNTLNDHFLPFAGLFAQEKDGALNQALVWNYLFFQVAAHVTGERQFETVAQAQCRHLNRLAEQDALTISPLLPLLEKILEKEPVLQEIAFELPENIYDPSTALIGKRAKSYQAVCTLHGGYTGLGYFRIGDAEIVNYGPQYLPLGDCLGFGIEGNHLSDIGLRKPHLQLKPKGFYLKGCVRLVDQPVENANSSFQLSRFRGIWFETEQELSEQQLSIQTSFLGFEGWDSVAFSFFIKAKKCWINSKIQLQPKTFERYEGSVQPILLEGHGNSFRLSAVHSGTMQVIPLGGGDNFWGADFLVAYLLDSKQRHYRWLAMS
jgi:hypothetical protein